MKVELLVFCIFACVLVSADQQFPTLNYPFYNNQDYQYNGLFGGRGIQNRQCGRRLSYRDCRLFNFGSDFVSKDDFISKVMGQENGWFPLLTYEMNSVAFGKCNTKYNLPDENDVFVRPEVCYNLETRKCDVFSEIMTITEDRCGRVLLLGVNGTSTESIYSQDLDSYFWRDLCSNKVGDECTDGRYIDLNVKGDRFVSTADRAADITGLPWDLITADLRNIFGKDIRDPDFRHSYLGTECPFPG